MMFYGSGVERVGEIFVQIMNVIDGECQFGCGFQFSDAQIRRKAENIYSAVELLVIVFIRTTNSSRLPSDISLTPDTCSSFQSSDSLNSELNTVTDRY